MGPETNLLQRLAQLWWHLTVREEPDAKPHELTSLEKLPAELLEMIATHLPLSSVATLALCSRRLLQTLGTQYWDLLKDQQHPADRTNFLELIDPEISDLVLCMECKKFHRPYWQEWLSAKSEGRPPGCVSNEQSARASGKTYGQRNWFSPVQMTLKRHRLGLDTSAELKNLACVHVRSEYPSLAREQSTWATRTTSVPRIVDGQMVFRNQFHLFLRAGAPFPLECLLTWTPCPHMSPFFGSFGPSKWPRDPLSGLIKCRLHHVFTPDGCDDCRGWRRCESCDTEIRVDHKTWQGRGLSLLVTVYANMGSARSKTDPKWSQHLHSNKCSISPVARYSDEVGKLAEAFDAQGTLSIKESLFPTFARKFVKIKPSIQEGNMERYSKEKPFTVYVLSGGKAGI